MNIKFYIKAGNQPFSFGKSNVDKLFCDIFLNNIRDDIDEIEDILEGLTLRPNNYAVNGESYRLSANNGEVKIVDLEEIETPSGLMQATYDMGIFIDVLKAWKKFCILKRSCEGFFSIPQGLSFFKDHYGAFHVAARDENIALAEYLENDASRGSRLHGVILKELTTAKENKIDSNVYTLNDFEVQYRINGGVILKSNAKNCGAENSYTFSCFVTAVESWNNYLKSEC